MRMGMDKEWGTEIELVAIADLLGTPILVTNDSADPEVIQNWIYPKSTKTTEVINPRRMRERVTVVGLCVCVCVCPVEISSYVRLHQPYIAPTVYK